jgi:LysR family transcriptional activator of nhaA
MEWLNYHHLYYFWTVVKEGSITGACAKLRLAQPTISGQLRQFEESLGEKVFTRAGRKLVPTEVGQLVYRYADEIFTAGHELIDVLRGRHRGRPAPFHVGISDAMPKLIAFRALDAVLKMQDPVRLICFEDSTGNLLQNLSAHGLDMMLTDTPVLTPLRPRVFNHELGSCGVTFFAAPKLAARFRRGFPASLDNAPFLAPLEGSALRRSLDQWFERHHIRPSIVGEFEDSALLKVFGQAGAGIFPTPSAIEGEVSRQYGVKVLGRTNEIVERFYAVSVERRLKHPAVLAVSTAARALLQSS